MENSINGYYGENIEELVADIQNETLQQLVEIDMLDFYMTVSTEQSEAGIFSRDVYIQTMSKYVILGCDHNMNDCVDDWSISLTEFGLCVVYEKPDNATNPSIPTDLGMDSSQEAEEIDSKPAFG